MCDKDKTLNQQSYFLSSMFLTQMRPRVKPLPRRGKSQWRLKDEISLCESLSAILTIVDCCCTCNPEGEMQGEGGAPAGPGGGRGSRPPSPGLRSGPPRPPDPRSDVHDGCVSQWFGRHADSPVEPSGGNNTHFHSNAGRERHTERQSTFAACRTKTCPDQRFLLRYKLHSSQNITQNENHLLLKALWFNYFSSLWSGEKESCTGQDRHTDGRANGKSIRR